MKRGNLVFSRSSTIKSWLIRKILRFKYSHVFLAISETKLIESDWSGVVISNIDKYSDSILEVKNLNLTTEQIEILINLVSTKLNQKYDFTLFFGGILSKMIHRPRTGEGLWNNIYQNTCSELISEGLKKLGKTLPFEPSQMTPKDLYFSL